MRRRYSGLLIAAIVVVLMGAISSGVWAAGDNCDQAKKLFSQSLALEDRVAQAKLLKKAAELCPGDVLIWNNLAAAYELKSDYEQAKAAYLKALEVDPGFPPAQAGLGDVAMQEGRFQEAEKRYSQFLAGVETAKKQGDPMGLAKYEEKYKALLKDAQFRLQAQQMTASGVVSKAIIIRGLDHRRIDRVDEEDKPAAPARMTFNNILFAFNSAELADGAKPQLKEIAAALKSPDLQGQKFIIAGHTDNFGTEIYNQELSRKRAANVKKYFVDQGVEANRLRAMGYGETRLIVLSGNKNTQAPNRRVELINNQNADQ